MPIKCYASFWDMWKAGAVHPSLKTMPKSHVQRPRLLLVAEWTKYIPEGFTMKLKRVVSSCTEILNKI